MAVKPSSLRGSVPRRWAVYQCTKKVGRAGAVYQEGGLKAEAVYQEGGLKAESVYHEGGQCTSVPRSWAKQGQCTKKVG